MDEGLVGILALLGISVAVSVVAHRRSTRYLLASFVSGVISITLFLGLTLALGQRDPLIAIAAIFGGGIAVLIALIVGGVFVYRRSRAPQRS